MPTNRRDSTRRLKWTPKMNSDLLDCKLKAKQITASENPPRKPNGRKIGYMDIMKDLWEEAGYAELKLNRQHLRDQATKLEKTMGDVRNTILLNIGHNESDEGNENNLLQEEENEIDLLSEDALINQNSVSSNVNKEQETPNLNITTSIEIPEETEQRAVNDEVQSLLSKASVVYASVIEAPGEFQNRKMDTRIKQKPTKSDITNINTAIDLLVKQHLSPARNSTNLDVFWKLWIVNCIIYSVVISLLVIKGWKRPSNGTRKKATNNKVDNEYHYQTSELRKKISIAKAELDRIRENRKMTKRGKKNRQQLIKECDIISATTLVSYMERKKCELRKLKRSFDRQKKVQESRALNKKYDRDPGVVYSIFTDMVKKDNLNERPKYSPNNTNEDTGNAFNNIEEASTFWRTLWEKSGTGDASPGWLKDIEEAIDERIPDGEGQDEWELSTNQAVEVIRKKRNWSAPGPDRITNYWWKHSYVVHDEITAIFLAISDAPEYPSWFTQGKTTLIPKPGEFSSENQRPITCLNTVYKWFTACLLVPINRHLEINNLMESQQRGAKSACSGTTDNLLIDRMVIQDCVRGKRNISMAWIDVKKAYDSVDHKWLSSMIDLHKFPRWIDSCVKNLYSSWNTRIVAKTKNGMETSEMIRFERGLPQGDALCPRLFTLCLNPVAWMLKATEGYMLSKPISTKVTDLLYIDDLKVFAASESKLHKVLKSTQTAMKDIGLELNPKKCSMINVKRGKQVCDGSKAKLDDTTEIASLNEGERYKFLGVLENLKQDDKMALQQAAEKYLQKVSVIWSSPLSDWNKVNATNQFALPTLSYLMWTQTWPIAELKQIDRETRKILTENGGRHPTSSNAVLYLPRKMGGRGLRSIEMEYKLTKIKAALKVYENHDPMIGTVRSFDEKASERGHQSLGKDAVGYARELNLELKLLYPQSTCFTVEGDEIPNKQIKKALKDAQVNILRKEVENQKWEGKLFADRWKDEDIHKACFSWMHDWKTAPTHTVAGIQELYQQLLPTKLYLAKKVRTLDTHDYTCRMCGKEPESVAHVLAGCGAIAQSKYVERHNSVLRILFFEILTKYKLLPREDYAWYKPIKPKPVYEDDKVRALWDVPLFADTTQVRANRIDVQIIDKTERKVILIEMSCPWISNRAVKAEEKTRKYGPLRLELKRQYPGYQLTQHNIIMDVLGGYSEDVRKSIQSLVGERSQLVLKKMQKAMLTSTLNIARSMKILDHEH